MITIPAINLYDAISLIGVAVYVLAYIGVQLGAINGNRLGYTCLTGLAAGCVLFGMSATGNLIGIMVSALFLAISLFGIARRIVLRVKHRRRIESWVAQNHMSAHLSSR